MAGLDLSATAENSTGEKLSAGYLVGPGSVVDELPYVVRRDVAIAARSRWLTDRLTCGVSLTLQVNGLDPENV